MTMWKPDPFTGPWVLVTATGGDVWHPVDDTVFVFETQQDAQQWADEFHRTLDFAPFRLHPKRVGWLRPTTIPAPTEEER